MELKRATDLRWGMDPLIYPRSAQGDVVRMRRTLPMRSDLIRGLRMRRDHVRVRIDHVHAQRPSAHAQVPMKCTAHGKCVIGPNALDFDFLHAQ